MPSFCKVPGREFWLNCGLCRERGIVRTSTRRRTPWARRSSTNSAKGRVEWPTVRMAGKAVFARFERARTVFLAGFGAGFPLVCDLFVIFEKKENKKRINALHPEPRR